MNARKLTMATVTWLCTLTGTLAFSAAPALAKLVHKFEAQISEYQPGTPLGGVDGLTVDAGHLLVGEPGRIGEFDASSNAFVAELSPSSLGLPGFEAAGGGVTVGHSTGETELYVGVGGSRGGATVAAIKIGACGTVGCATFQKQWTGADTPSESFVQEKGEGSGRVEGVAVDESSALTAPGDWARGDVFVATDSEFRGQYPNLKVVDVFKPKTSGGEEYVTQLKGTPLETEPVTGEGELFQGPYSIAVSEVTGDVMVDDISRNAVDIFEPTGLNQYAFVRRLTGPSAEVSFEAIRAVVVAGAVSGNGGTGAGDIFLAATAGGVDGVYEFAPNGEYLDRITEIPGQGGFLNLDSVAVDPASGRLFAADFNSKTQNGTVDVFGPAAVAPDVTTAAASSVKARGATLNGTVNPVEKGAATCSFVWGTSASFGEPPVECSQAISAAEGAGNAPLERNAQLTGLQPDTTYFFRLHATNAKGTNEGEPSQDQQFTTLGPGIHGESASTVTSESATLSALIDPNNAATTYYFQYGTSASYGESVPLAPGALLGSVKGDLKVSVHIQGLAAGTTYHYRVVALSEPGGEPVSVEGADATFTTQPTGSEFTLPDGRAWEMVTPPNKQGAGIYPLGVRESGDDIQAAQDGDGITFGASGPFVANPAGNRSIEVDQVISLRGAPGVWSSQDITTPHYEGAVSIEVGHSAEYKLFSSDLSLGLVEPGGFTALPPLPAGSEKTVYLRHADGGYEALVSAANVPQGCKFAGEEGKSIGIEFLDGTPDMRHIVLHSTPVYGPACLSEGGVKGELYEWSEGKLDRVSVLPDGEATEGLLGSGHWSRQAISKDGSRVVFTGAVGANSDQTVYLRDVAKGETVQIPEGKATFQTADSEDSKVFFTSNNALEVFEVTSAGGEPLAGHTTKLTTSGAVEGVIGASEDGSYVYFVDSGVLGDGAEHGAESEGHNLYVEHYDQAKQAWALPVFIAALSSEDSPTWGEASIGGEENFELINLTSRVSPNGRYLAFMSERGLTGYDNRDANSEVPDEEVFEYDAATGQVVCASCNPTGARPVGKVWRHSGEGFVVGLWADRWVSASVPGWTIKGLGGSGAVYQSRYLSDEGRLFFDSQDALVPADVNGAKDVYEYEPGGVGSCRPPGYGQGASDVFVAGSGGCVGLISAGTSAAESTFMDASESGGDVFFLTLSKLSLRDYDTSLDVYDAHECTAVSPCAPAEAAVPPPCTTGDSCKPAPSPQPTTFGAPASSTFSGAGNVSKEAPGAVRPRALTRTQKLARALGQCRHRRGTRARRACVRRARARYATRRARGARDTSGVRGYGR